MNPAVATSDDVTSPTTTSWNRNRDDGTESGCPRDFLGNRFVYTTLSSRAGGLVIGVNMNPDKRCNFDCVYCEVDRAEPPRESHLDVPVMTAELERALKWFRSREARAHPTYRELRPELLELRHVALSGDGEPTLSLNFASALEAVVHLRACGGFSFFKIVLITNASGLDRPDVTRSLALLKSHDEVWAKLEAGTQGYMNRVNRPDSSLETIQANILALARRRPVIIQSLFPLIGSQPPPAEIESFSQRLRELKDAGANIPLVQVYSATRPAARPECGHLPLRVLARIAQRVREVTGLRTEVF